MCLACIAPPMGGALRDDTKNGCEAEYPNNACFARYLWRPRGVATGVLSKEPSLKMT